GDGKAGDLVIPLLCSGRRGRRAVAQQTQRLPRAQLGEFPQLAPRILKFSSVCVADGQAAIEEGSRSRRLLLGCLQPFDCFIALAHADQRRTEPLIHGEPRYLAAIEPDRILEKGYCLSRSPGFGQSKGKVHAIRLRVCMILQKSCEGG